MDAPHLVETDVLDRFAHGVASADERIAVISHLLGGCRSCSRHLQPRPIGTGQNRYDGIVDRAFARAMAIFELRRAAAELGRELLRHPRDRQELLAKSSPRFWKPELCDLLIEKSQHNRFGDRKRMQHLARLAVAIASQVAAASLLTAAGAEDLQARAHSTLADALRVAGDLPAADRAIAQAREHLGRGTRDRLLRAQVLCGLASLRFDQRRLEESIELLREIVAASREACDRGATAQALARLGVVTREAGRPGEAVSVLLEAARLIDSTADLRLALHIGHALVCSEHLLDSGAPAARRSLTDVKRQRGRTPAH